MVTTNATSGFHRALARFVRDAPFRYFDRSIAAIIRDLMTANRNAALQALSDEEQAVNHALASTFRERVAWHDEDEISLATEADTVRLEHSLHPDYLHYLEHCFQNLMRVVVRVMRANGGADLQPNDLPGWMVTLAADPAYEPLTRGYHRIVRNGLAHGNQSILEKEILYTSYGDTQRLAPREIARLHDMLVDVTNGMVAGLLSFMGTIEPSLSHAEARRIPLGLSWLRLRADHGYTGFDVVRLSEEELIGTGGRQLLIRCTAALNSVGQHQLDGLCLVAKATKAARGRYERVGILIDTGLPVTGWWFLPAAPIEDHYANNRLTSGLRAHLANTAQFWHDDGTFSTVVARAKSILSQQAAAAKDQLEQFKQEGPWSIKRALRESAGDLRRWFVYAVVPGAKAEEKERLEAIVSKIVWSYRFRPLRGRNLTKETGLPLFPNEIHVELFDEDQRFRNLRGNYAGRKRLVMRRIWKSEVSQLKQAFARPKESVPVDA